VTFSVTSRLALVLGAIFMFCAVVAGAFGAHLLRGYLSPEMLGVWLTGVQYQAWHALALLAIGLYLERHAESRWVWWSARLFTVGILLFSGSLYLLALTGVREWGTVTPLGGVAFLVAWLLLALGVGKDHGKPAAH
jgi:uncharacterized membrane protein YgdD (TMEM256/DUF423 family)